MKGEINVEGLSITIANGNVTIGGNILKYATDNEMLQMREILMRIGRRYKNDEVPNFWRKTPQR